MYWKDYGNAEALGAFLLPDMLDEYRQIKYQCNKECFRRINK